MLDILIKNANIITMNDALPVISGGCIGIENGKISFVSDKNSPEMQIAAERIIDADGNIVTETCKSMIHLLKLHNMYR